ncbi:MAG TPA: lytic murein transglycosylase [Micrococcaceae bacterium]|nr:lytic murein transglycosylase [Micrococcaceae bacterium]
MSPTDHGQRLYRHSSRGRSIFTVAALGALLVSALSANAEPTVVTDDVERFYRIYDAAGGHPTADLLQREYLDQGSDGLKHFAKIRNITGERIAKAISERPEIYDQARQCAVALPQVKARVGAALSRFSELYSDASFPAVTVSVGRGRPVAVAGPNDGINIGLEALCATAFINPDIEDRFVRVMVHEFVHVQQVPELTEKPNPTVLEVSLVEGSAEFITELLTGDVAYAYMADLVAGREAEIERAFVPDMDATDLSKWLYNSTPSKPGDLGYWVGYRIARTYYSNAADKRQALKTIISMRDAKKFLAMSGWAPESLSEQEVDSGDDKLESP